MRSNIFLCASWPFVYLLWRHVYSSPLSIYLKVGRKLLLLSLGISSKRLFYRALIHVLVRVSREAEQTRYVGKGVYLYACVCLFLFFIEVQLLYNVVLVSAIQQSESAICIHIYGLPWWLRWLSVCLQCGRPGFDPWVRKIPWRRKRQPTPVLLPGKFHGRRSLVGYSPWGYKELDTTEWLHFFIHIYAPSWTSLPPCYPTHLGHHRALDWAPCSIQYVPTSYLFYTW